MLSLKVYYFDERDFHISTKMEFEKKSHTHHLDIFFSPLAFQQQQKFNLQHPKMENRDTRL